MRPTVPADPAKQLAGATSAAVLAAVIWPVRQNWRRKPRDSFPLSYYPMFSAKRKATGQVTHLVGVDEHGEHRVLPYRLVGPGGMNQARRQLHRLARGPQAQAAASAIAGRVAARSSKRYREVVEVRIVTGTYRFDDFFAGRRQPERERVHARATVSRAAR